MILLRAFRWKGWIALLNKVFHFFSSFYSYFYLSFCFRFCFYVYFCCLSFLSCQQKETRITESFCCRIESEIFVLDTRSAFEHNMFRISGSVRMNWEDFYSKKEGEPYRLRKNLDDDIKRLSLLGLDLNSSLLIVGHGKKGEGEEGKLAWILLYLGFKNVNFTSIDDAKGFGSLVSETFDRSRLKKNKDAWTPNYRQSLFASRDEVLKVFFDLKQRRKAFSRKKWAKKWIIDVSEKGSFKKVLTFHWKSFFNSKGRPHLGMRRKLLKRGLKRKDRILVISRKGFKSSAVVAALYLMGFKNSAHFDGEYENIVSSVKMGHYEAK